MRWRGCKRGRRPLRRLPLRGYRFPGQTTRRVAPFPILSSRAEWPTFSSVRAARTSAMERGTAATNAAKRKPMARPHPPSLPGGLVCAGMIGVGRVGQFTVESSKLRRKMREEDLTQRSLRTRSALSSERRQKRTDFSPQRTQRALGSERGGHRSSDVRGGGVTVRGGDWGGGAILRSSLLG